MHAEKRTIGHESRLIVSALAIGTLSGAVPVILPGLVGLLKDGYGFTMSQLGYLSSTDLWGLTLGSAVGAKLVSRIGLRKSAKFGLVVAAAANAAAAFASSFWPLLCVRILAGVGAGCSISACYVIFGQSKHVDRNFSYFLICQQVLGAITLPWMPTLSSLLGVAGIFACLASLLAFAVAATRLLPPADSCSLEGRKEAHARATAWLALFSLFVYFVSASAVWAYIELIGESSGVAQQAAATGLAIASLAGIAGPTVAAVLETRFGRAIPFSIGICVGLISLYMLGFSRTPLRFACAASLFNIAWNYCVPYQFASLAAVDRSGRLVSWAAGISTAGYAVGPMAAALAVTDAGFGNVLWLSAAFSVVSLFALFPAWFDRSESVSREDSYGDGVSRNRGAYN